MVRYTDVDRLMLLIPTEELVARMAIANALTEDVVKVVRCKDCIHLSNDRIAPKWERICRKYGCGKALDGFCDEGERK